MNWFLIIIIAYLLNAVAMVIDKALLKKSIPEPVVYTFYIGLLGLIFIPLLMPFGFAWPGWVMIGFSFLSGIFFVAALLIFFRVLKTGEASRVIPLTGGMNPIMILVLAFVFLGERLSAMQLSALALIVIGTYIITLEHTDEGFKMSRRIIFLGVISSLLFAVSYTSAKHVYEHVSFINGFIWTRLGSLIAVFGLLILPKYRKLIFGNVKSNQKQIKTIFIVGQALAGISFLMLNYAIAIGSVTLSNALQGLQYVFLFLIIIFLSKKYPDIIHEKINQPIIIQKIIAIFLISAGLFLITING